MVKSTGATQKMSEELRERTINLIDTRDLSAGEREELIALGLLSTLGGIQPPRRVSPPEGYTSVGKSGIEAHSVLNEAYDYEKPSSFSRGLRLDLGNYRLLIISGTASVDERGETAHVGDFRAQCWRTYRNITTLLEAEGGSWKDVVKCTCYLRDIERDYEEFNKIRTAFFQWQELDPLPASVGIQARLCRENLLVEIEAVALLKKSD
jgi:enamine deaminase RidA (YjgF/YER057c/UK114 family)